MHIELYRDAVPDLGSPGSRQVYSVSQSAPCRTDRMQPCRLHGKGKSLTRLPAQHEIEIAGELIDRHRSREKGATRLQSCICGQLQRSVRDFSLSIEGDSGCGGEPGEERRLSRLAALRRG